MQDHLYKDFVKSEKDHSKVVDELKVATRQAEEASSLEQMKVKKLEALVQSLEKASPEDLKSQRIELTK